ncbi:MAG TPA: hypothetical protein VE963_09700, partial [Reyranella sp.]|nr:hypothetical protein [Reyranella sp.]
SAHRLLFRPCQRCFNSRIDLFRRFLLISLSSPRRGALQQQVSVLLSALRGDYVVCCWRRSLWGILWGIPFISVHFLAFCRT